MIIVSKAGFVQNWWRSVDQPIIIAALSLIAISIILVTTAGPAVSNRIGLEESYFIKKHLIFICVSLSFAFIISLFDKKRLTRFALLGLFANIILLIIVQFLGYEVKGAKRWLNIAGFSLQPSELVKPCFIVVTAWILSLKNKDESFPSFYVALALYLLVTALIIIQPDIGMLVTISSIWAIQLFLAGLPLIWFIVIGFSSLTLLLCAYYLLPHVAQRINSFLDPSKHENYQVNKSLLAFKNGGLYGRGPGEGVVKQVLPDSHTDFIFAVAAESIINIGVNLNLLPTKGMTLPFISSGGSSILAVSICFGMLIGLTKRKTNLTKFRLNKIEATFE